MMRVLGDWLLTAERVAVHLPSETAVVADLHLGYAEARRRGGEAVPADSPDEPLSGLLRLLRRRAARRLVVAGDLLEDGRCTQALAAFRGWLDREQVELLAVVPGNHDERLEDGNLPLAPEGFSLGRWRVLHGDGPLPEGPVVQGHEHPCLRWTPRNGAYRPHVGRGYEPGAADSPCYLASAGRLILPAFSKEAAGVNVLSSRRWRSFRCYPIAGDRVLDLGELVGIKKVLSSAPRPGV